MYELRSTRSKLLGVILRSETTKNLEILRPAQDDSSFLRGTCPELAEGLRMTNVVFRCTLGNKLFGQTGAEVEESFTSQAAGPLKTGAAEAGSPF